MLDATEMANHGMICTKPIVLSVATFEFLELRPVHIANQATATRLARKASLSASTIVKLMNADWALTPLIVTVVVRPDGAVLVVVTMVLFVVAVPVVAAGEV